MPLDAWLLFLPACFAMTMMVGPNNIVLLANASRFGWRRAWIGATGRLPVFVVMIALTILGLGRLLAASALAFEVLRYAGVAYLLWLAFQVFRNSLRAKAPEAVAEDAAGADAPVPNAPSLWRLFRQDAQIAASNPKAILIFTALLPPFVVVEAGNPDWQMIVIGATFLVLEALSCLIYAVIGSEIGRRAGKGQVWIDRFAGIALIGAALSLLRSHHAAG